MLSTLILAANVDINLAELGSMSFLKQVYDQRIFVWHGAQNVLFVT